MLGIGILGIGLAIFFGLRPQTERELVYAINPVRTAVVTAGQASGLAVLHEGEPLGSVDVTAVQVAIWNAGKQSIRHENILEDVVIVTNPPVQILEASIRHHSREVTGFTLIETPGILTSGRLPVSWRILEKDDGASIQLIYVGTEEVTFHVEGVIEGLRGIKDVELGVDIKTPQEQIQEEQIKRWVYGIFSLFFGAVTVFVIYVALLKPRRWRDLYMVFTALSVFGLLVWQYFSISARIWPPFGF